MQPIRMGAAALNQTPLDWEGNRRNIVAAIAAARDEGVAVLCLPELTIPGYGCEDAFLSPGVLETSRLLLAELLSETRGMVVSLGLPVLYRNGVFNACALAVDGRLAGLVAKRHLAGDGIHYEPRWFSAWPEGATGEVELDGESFPIGDLHFEVGGVRIGFEICEEAWIGPRPGAALVRQGIDVILGPNASHFAFRKIEVQRRFVLEGSRAFGVAYLYSNLLGNEAGRVIYDGGAMVASGGRLVATAPRFSFRDFNLTAAVIDVDRNRMLQAERVSTRPRVTGNEAARVQVAFTYPRAEPEPVVETSPSWEMGDRMKEEEFARAVALGLLDYLRKSRSNGFVISVSGGVDSSATACLVALMVHLAVAELGLDGFRRRLGSIESLREAPDERAFVGCLLTTLYQATRNSSETTRAAARGVAEAIGSTHLELDVDSLYEGYVHEVSGALGRELTWDDDDVPLQNIQARVRAPSAWLVANVKGALLLATANRSEAAVGYSTMDGDTAGGLSPIAGVDKNFLRHWLRWLERDAPVGCEPIPALAAVNAQAPTAELRPPEAAQTDEADLMPYDLLEAVERLAIGEKKMPLEVYRALRRRFSVHDARQLAAWVERFFRLWAKNQWKRERYAPSFHLDDQNLDPKTWCRYPILSGGFERELAELRREAEGDAD